MLNNGCVPSESGPTEVTADFRFTRVMAEQAARARLTLDDDQLSLIARLDALGQQLVSTTGSPQGVYVWGRTGRGKSFILDHFFASLPLAARRRVHFHHFFRELHQRLNAPGAPDLQTVMRQMTSGCRLLCFDEFHLHDPGDAMLLYNIACIRAMAGATDEALDCLERAVQAGMRNRGWLEHDSNLDSIRSDPRFAALMHELARP